MLFFSCAVQLVTHAFNATDTDIHAYDLIVRFLAVGQGCSYTREDLIFLWRHECAPLHSSVWNCTPVRIYLTSLEIQTEVV